MKEDEMNEIMAMYSEITKTTTIGIDSSHSIPPLFSNGLDISLLIDYTDFDEIISFIHTELENATRISVGLNTFHTFHTKKLFVYNIIFIKNSKGSDIALVAGPVMTYVPSGNALDRKLIKNELPFHKKNEFIRIVNNLPLASNERIYQLGRLLLLLVKTASKNLNSSIQEFHGRENTEEELYVKHLKDTIDNGYDNKGIEDVYKFCSILMDKIMYGNVSAIIELIGEYTYLFWNMESLADNNRSLKDKAIIICSIACHFAIQANAPYERMYYSLWKSITKLEKLNSTNDIIMHLTATIEGFAHAVYVLSDNTYSLHINRVLQYIKGHFAEKITLRQLSEHIKVNPVYLSSLIKKETRMSLSNHINLIRIEESKKLLIYTNKSIHEIAYEVGYIYQNHFNVVFKNLEGLTPLEYRKIKGSKNYVPHK